MITLNSRCRDAADTEENEASHVKLGRCKRSRCRLLASRAVPADCRDVGVDGSFFLVGEP